MGVIEMDLKEWAESLYRQGDAQLADYGKEILELIDQEDELERLYQIENDLLHQAQWHCPLETEPLKIIERLGERAELVEECEDRLKKHGFEGQDLDDQCEELARTVSDIKETLEKMGGYVVDDSSDLDSLVQELCQRPKYDL